MDVLLKSTGTSTSIFGFGGVVFGAVAAFDILAPCLEERGDDGPAGGRAAGLGIGLGIGSCWMFGLMSS